MGSDSGLDVVERVPFDERVGFGVFSYEKWAWGF